MTGALRQHMSAPLLFLSRIIYIPEMDRLDANRTIPQTLKEILGFRWRGICACALEAACSMELSSESGGGIPAECESWVVLKEAESDTRGRHVGYVREGGCLLREGEQKQNVSRKDMNRQTLKPGEPFWRAEKRSRAYFRTSRRSAT